MILRARRVSALEVQVVAGSNPVAPTIRSPRILLGEPSGVGGFTFGLEPVGSKGPRK
jgi:hypothetical protein